MSLTIVPLLPEHWTDVARIYAEGIATRLATFTTEVPSWEPWDTAHHPFCRFVTLEDTRILGWVAISPVSQRICYRGVAEHSVYITSAARGKGVGLALMQHLIHTSEAYGIWTLMGVVFPENAASLALHERVGFRVVGRRERIAQLDGEWRDTLVLERRSTRIG